MNGRPIGHEQPHGLHPWLTTRFLCAALACLALVLALFLAPAQTGFAQGGSVVCTALTMTPGTLPGSVMGASYSQTFHTTQNWGCCATLPFVYSKYSGSLPAGLTLTTAGVLSGTTVTPGSYTFILRSEDSGSKPNGYWCQGQYTIVVSGSNHAPTFAAGPDVTVLEDAPAYSVDWASNMSPGGTQDANQTLTFKVTNDNNALFSVQPAISATDGKLSFTLKPNGNGVANVVVYLTDNGGTANGGSDTGAQTNFKITVTPVEDPQAGPTYTVNSTAWTTDGMCGEMNCTLREAIDAANSDGQDSTIELAPGAIYTLQGDVGGSAGLPSITSAMTINGHGAIIEPSTTSGMPVIRMLSVPSGGNLTLNLPGIPRPRHSKADTAKMV